MFLSIIVPAYNVEQYINKCISSIQNQDIDDYEIIVINDCSTDNTLEVVKKMASDKMVIIDKPQNTGLSDTRNIGLSIAKGEYVMFVDSDDYLSENTLSKIKKFASSNKSDLIYLNYIINRNGKISKIQNFSCPENKNYDSSFFLKKQLMCRILPIPACFAIYRRDFLNQNNIRFKVGILHEDELWTPLCLLKAKKVGTLNIYFYNYIIRENSITQKKDKTKNGLDLLQTSEILDEISNSIDDNEMKKLFKNHVAMIYMKAVSRGNLYKKQYKKRISKTFPFKKAYFFKDKIKAIIFFVSPRLYCSIDRKYGNNI